MGSVPELMLMAALPPSVARPPRTVWVAGTSKIGLGGPSRDEDDGVEGLEVDDDSCRRSVSVDGGEGEVGGSEDGGSVQLHFAPPPHSLPCAFFRLIA